MKLLEQKIESLLFYKNEPVSFAWLSKVLKTPKETIKETVAQMDSYYDNRGIVLVQTNDDVALMTSESTSEILAELTQAKEEKELSKQALETLAIIAYRGKSTKAEIDYIRGVNSVFILRNLLIRGLITKKPNMLDKRSPLYVPTHDLLSFLGISSLNELPQYEGVSKKMEDIDEQYQSELDTDKEPIVVGNTQESDDEEGSEEEL
ncbi:MAG: SMC-Scp complex subunit ScpB [Candidatus Pacebacteria bacterium]|nr:SMC-Scp complex subunit ScpB [Candidatus Paceibacterota bacterium]